MMKSKGQVLKFDPELFLYMRRGGNPPIKENLNPIYIYIMVQATSGNGNKVCKLTLHM